MQKHNVAGIIAAYLNARDDYGKKIKRRNDSGLVLGFQEFEFLGIVRDYAGKLAAELELPNDSEEFWQGLSELVGSYTSEIRLRNDG